MPALNLTPEQAAQYERRYRHAAALRDAAIASSDQREAKKWRQQISRLRLEYERVSDENDRLQGKELPRQRLTLEERVLRIEQHLGLD